MSHQTEKRLHKVQPLWPDRSMADTDVHIGHARSATEIIHQTSDFAAPVVDDRSIMVADAQRLLPPAPASYVPSFSGIFQGVQQYEPQENDECANILDLAVCCCLLRTPGTAPGVACVQEAFTLLDGENGKNDGALSLTETKRLIAAMLCVIREVRMLLCASVAPRTSPTTGH